VSELDAVPGLGPARKKALLTHFGSVKKMRAADEKEIAAVQGVGPKLAADRRRAAPGRGPPRGRRGPVRRSVHDRHRHG